MSGVSRVKDKAVSGTHPWLVGYRRSLIGRDPWTDYAAACGLQIPLTIKPRIEIRTRAWILLRAEMYGPFSNGKCVC
jgi:hypothetical protein